jgi:hypothetical protein
MCLPNPEPCFDFGFFLRAQCSLALLAAAVSSSMVVLTAGSSPGAGQFVTSVVRPCPCTFRPTLHIGAAEEKLLCSSFCLLLYAFSSLTPNQCYLESKLAGAGVSADYVICAPHGVMGSAPRMDLTDRSARRAYILHELTSHFIYSQL